ncbi:MAG TPA: hypothetical protein VFZ56_06890 [Gemmatimonadaceae bacterium]
MQQTDNAAAPAAPQAPPPPPGPGVPTAVVSPEGQLTLQNLPSTVQEVEGLHARRSLLRDQLVRATNRREELVAQMSTPMSDDVRAGMQQRLTLLDQRILEIERDQAATEQLLSNAPPELLAMTESSPSPGGMMGEDEAVALAFFTFGLGLALAVIVGRWRRRRALRRGGATPIPAVHDRRLDQLTQAVDAIAEEVERIGEGQRFVTQLLSERRPAPALGEEARRP